MSETRPELCGKCGADIAPARRVDFTPRDGTRVCDQYSIKETPRPTQAKKRLVELIASQLNPWQLPRTGLRAEGKASEISRVRLAHLPNFQKRAPCYLAFFLMFGFLEVPQIPEFL